MKASVKKWLWRIIPTLVIIGALATAGFLWVSGQPSSSPFKQIPRELAAKQATKKVSSSERKKIAAGVMEQDEKGGHLTKQGYVAIPDMGIFMPIYDDAYNQHALDLGANTANKDTPVPKMGEGNYTLAAHNWDNGYTGFSALQQTLNQNAPYLVNGQTGQSDWLDGKKIYMANADGIYTYTVRSQTTVNQDDVSVLDVNARINGNPKLTIITCLFPNIKYRIITNAEFTNFSSWQNAPDRLVNDFNTSKVPTNIKP
ncbi:class A sortase [Lactobacillaceae bacterium L1_55_11]|nr:class A sortase [Lactobacillaceae bacterium L1_55_11]